MRISDWSSDVCASDLDAKRGDIGNTSLMYARAFFEQEGSGLNFDAVTVAPYMGIDSVTPFLGFDGKWAILLALTSNQGNQDFQYLETEDDFLYEKVISTSLEWAGSDRLMYVVGRSEEHTSELQSLMRISYAVFCLKKKTQ